jgi:Transglutaminase-like superfamily
MRNIRDYYTAADAPMTAAGSSAAELRALPADLAAQCAFVQGLLIHRDLAKMIYGVTLTEQQRDDAHIRALTEMIERIRALDGAPLTVARTPERRMPAVCRHFTVMLCSILRAHGVPARARCGFGAYFNPPRYEDHWVAEYWNAAQSRWVLVDAQLDAALCKAIKPDFSPLDVPRDRFIIAGDAWRQCRSGRNSADLFGLSFIGLQGWWFIAGNVIRDLAALNGMEMLPWDVWGMMPKDDAEFTEEQRKQVDRLTDLTLADDAAFEQLRACYESDQRLRVPPVVFNALRSAPERVSS